MKKTLKIIILLMTIFGLYSYANAQQFGAPSSSFQRSLIPIDSTENVGTSTSPWDEGHFNHLLTGYIDISSTTATSTFSGNVNVSGNLQVDGALFAPISFISSGNITANAFITDGGASADFVKGDGSLDSSTYLTSVSGGDHGTLSGLADDDHTQYALLAGRSAGQTLVGGTTTTAD